MREGTLPAANRSAPLRAGSSLNKLPAAAFARRMKEPMFGYLFLLPSITLFGMFLFYPLIKSVYLSVHLTDPRGRVAAYVGLDNFTGLLSSAAFWNSLQVTAWFTILTVPTGIALGILTAALTCVLRPGMRLFQFVFSLPLALSVSTSAVIWAILFHPTLGVLNYLMKTFGFTPVQWLTDPSTALPSIALMTVWMQSGFNYIIVLSGLQSISGDYLDSAKIDGAGPVRTFVRIVLPLLSPTLFFLSVISVISSFQTFGQMHLMTKGGPAGSTEVFVYSIYKEAFVNYQYGTGSAYALVLFAIILVLTAIQFKFVEKKVHYQ